MVSKTCCDHTKKDNTKIKGFVYTSRVETAIKQEENRKEPLRNRWLFYMILCSLVCSRKASSKVINIFFLSSESPYRYSLAIDYISTQINLTTFSIPELKTGTYLMEIGDNSINISLIKHLMLFTMTV